MELARKKTAPNRGRVRGPKSTEAPTTGKTHVMTLSRRLGSYHIAGNGPSEGKQR